MAGCCAHGNEYSDSMKREKLLDLLRHCWLTVFTKMALCSMELVNWLLGGSVGTLEQWGALDREVGSVCCVD